MSEAPFIVEITPTGLRNLARLPTKAAAAVLALLDGSLCENPLRVTKPLRAELSGFRSANVGAYRVVCRVDEPGRTVYVHRVAHRADVYRPH